MRDTYVEGGGVCGNLQGIRCGMTGLTGRGSLLRGTIQRGINVVRPVDVRLKEGWLAGVESSQGVWRDHDATVLF